MFFGISIGIAWLGKTFARDIVQEDWRSVANHSVVDSIRLQGAICETLYTVGSLSLQCELWIFHQTHVFFVGSLEQLPPLLGPSSV